MRLGYDLRAAARTLARSPGFSAAVVLVLGLGLGAGTSIFSVVDAVLFRKLSVPASDRLVRLAPTPDPGNWSHPAFRDYAENADTVTLAAYSSGDAIDLSVDGSPAERVYASLVTSDYFRVMGIAPARGRLFGGEDEPVVVLSQAMFQKRFAGDPAVVGRAVRVNGHAFTIGGVVPPGFVGADLDSFPDVWIPISRWKEAIPAFAGEDILASRRFSWLEVVGRLRPGVELPGAQAQLDTLASRPRPELSEAEKPSKARVALVNDVIISEGATAKRLAWTLLAAAGFVLLLAASVVAGLFAVRAERRRSEIAVRLAIGASRRDLVRALLAESVLLAMVAAGLGLVVAAWATSLLSLVSAVELPIPLAAATPVLALRALLVAAGTALATGLACGLPAALTAGRGDLLPALKCDARTATAGRRRGTLGGAAVALQVAVSVVLLTGAGLLLRTLLATQAVDPGFTVDGALVTSLDVSRQGYVRDAGARLFEDLLDRVRARPGVKAAALARVVPVQDGGMRATVIVDGYVSPTGKDENVEYDVVTPGFFAALGLPLLKGRDFTPLDRVGTPDVCVVNQAFADRFLKDGTTLGRQLPRVAGSGPVEIVGIVATAKARSLREQARPAVYVPHAQHYLPGMTLVVRTDGDPRTGPSDLAAIVSSLDRQLPLYGVRTLREHVGRTLLQERLITGLLVAFGALALVLAAFGLFSVLAFATEVRRREIGIRMALGAEARDILRLVLSEASRLTAFGLLAGTAAALLLARSIQHLLFGVAPVDPVTSLAVVAVLGVSALFASYLPARRALRVDPIVALRSE